MKLLRGGRLDLKSVTLVLLPCWIVLFVSFDNWDEALQRSASVLVTTRKESPVVSLPDANLGRNFWNCNHNSSLCTFLTPLDFWQRYKHNHSQAWDHFGGRVNQNLPALTAFSWWSHDTVINKEYTTTMSPWWLPYNLTFCHVHKCGGTTVQHTLLAMRQIVAQSTHNKVYYYADVQTYKYSIGGGSSAAKQKNEDLRKRHIDNLAKQQTIVIVTVRDPVERFLSAIQQVMHYHQDLRDACLQKTAPKTIQCVLDWYFPTNNSMPTKQRHVASDVHLLPMMAHFRLLENVTLSVFHMRDLTTISQFLLLAAKSLVANETATLLPTIHSRDRSSVEYATSDVLANMNVDKHCTKDMKKRICRIYHMDVTLMRYLGYGTPHFISEASSISDLSD